MGVQRLAAGHQVSAKLRLADALQISMDALLDVPTKLGKYHQMNQRVAPEGVSYFEGLNSTQRHRDKHQHKHKQAKQGDQLPPAVQGGDVIEGLRMHPAQKEN
jgi:hypothetical protein